MISTFEHEDSVLWVNILQAELSILGNREQFKSVQLTTWRPETELRWALQRVLVNAIKTIKIFKTIKTFHYLVSSQPTRVLSWYMKSNKSCIDYCGIVPSCADTLDQWLMITTCTFAVHVPVIIPSVYIPSHTTTYAILTSSKLAPHEPSLIGLHAFISNPGYPSQHQKWWNIICPDEAACTLRQHLDRVNANIVRRRCWHHFSVSYIVLPHHYGKPFA